MPPLVVTLTPFPLLSPTPGGGFICCCTEVSAVKEGRRGEERLEAPELREAAGDCDEEVKEVDREEFTGVGGT